MSRHVAFVGSLPAEVPLDDDLAVFEYQIRGAGEHPIFTVARDFDRDWVLQYLMDRAKVDAFEVARPGGYGLGEGSAETAYDDFAAYRVRKGVRLRPEHVAMNRVDRIRRAADAYAALRDRSPALKGVRMQISQPAPIDLCLFVEAGSLAVKSGMPWSQLVAHPLVLARALRHLPVYAEAVAAEVAMISAEYPDLVAWQVESPLSTLAMVRVDALPGVRGLVAGMLAAHLADVLYEIVVGCASVAVVHPCYGGYKNKELRAPRSMRPVVTLLNALGTNLDGLGAARPTVHLPCAYGEHEAPLRPGFYQPLRKLDVGWRKLIAGVASASPTLSCAALAEFEQAAGRQAHAVGAACGLGRSDGERAAMVLRAMSAAADIAPFDEHAQRHQIPSAWGDVGGSHAVPEVIEPTRVDAGGADVA